MAGFVHFLELGVQVGRLGIDARDELTGLFPAETPGLTGHSLVLGLDDDVCHLSAC